MRPLALLARPWLLLALLLPSPTMAQVELISVPVVYDFPSHLGQAQSNRVCLSNNDISSFEVLAPLGGGGATLGSIPGPGFAPYIAETTDGLLVASGMSFIGQYSKTTRTLLRRLDFNPFLENVGPVVPLPSGLVLVAFHGSLRAFDGTLTQVGSFPTATRSDGVGLVVGLARQLDGSIVTCERTNSGGRRLTAYGPNGGVLWDVPIPAGERIAAVAGAIYVAHGTELTYGHAPSSLDVYSANGAALGSWSGPPGNPLSNIIDVAASPAGDLLFTLTFAAGGPVRVFSSPPVPTVRKTWGEVKAAFR